MNWIASQNYLALFFEVSDEDLKRIESDAGYIRSVENVLRLQNGTGRNAHIYSLTIKEGAPSIRWWVKELLKKYDSVSWWTVKNRRFFIRRRA
jgi:hypothetical protein